MQRKTWILIAVIVGLAQLSIPLYMIWNKEQTIRKGNSFLFEITPIDPTHPLKGKYITLNYLPATFTPKNSINNTLPVYAILGKNKKNEFVIRDLVNNPPKNTSNYIPVTFSNWATEKDTNRSIYSDTYTIFFPFTEFYMEESKAPRAEEIYRSLNQNTTQKAYAVVSIYKGDAAITDVIINGRSIVELSGE